MNYTSREVIRRLKQYDMFLESLKLTDDEDKKEKIKDQLDKIEKQILLDTNSEYEEEYMLLLGKTSEFIDEEKEKLRNIISLIISRREYLNERARKHKKITGSLVELRAFLGEDKLDDFKKRLKIIEKYENNKIKQDSLIKDIRTLDIKISEASRNVKANMRLNESLEKKMIALLDKALNNYGYYKLIEEKESIQKNFNSLKYATDMAKENLKSARETLDNDLILECENMLSEITLEYEDYNQKVNILKLIDIYDSGIFDYESLLSKREKMNDILKEISGTDIYLDINDELSKQYNTIKLEAQDIANYDNLKEERNKKNALLFAIEEENNSQEFKLVLEDLIKNEKKHQDERIREARKREYQERQKKLAEDQKIEASRVKRQKLIEEARLKDQLERTAKLKELQEKTVINANKREEKTEEENVNKVFENIMAGTDSFNTSELFENTKILPNRPKENIITEEKKNENGSDDVSQESILTVIDPNLDIQNKEEKTDDLLWTPVEGFSDAPDIVDLFKEEKKNKEELNFSSDKNMEKENDIYKLLEQPNNVIWKSTEQKEVNTKIPVIGNNNLVPELLDKKEANLDFPSIKEKEGEFLWKETI